jgi:hypothetical protein
VGDTQTPTRAANFKVTLAWTDISGAGLQNVLRLSLVFPTRGDLATAIDPASADDRLRRMAGNNVQKLEVRGLMIPAHQTLAVNMTVTAVNIVDNPRTGGKENQGYALVWKTWYG